MDNWIRLNEEHIFLLENQREEKDYWNEVILVEK